MGISDAVPKKRGPKTDVLEALVKRIDGLEKRLKDEGKAVDEGSENAKSSIENDDYGDTQPLRPTIDTDALDEIAVYSPTPTPVRYVNSALVAASEQAEPLPCHDGFPTVVIF